jgi:hypothetical protein
MNKAIDTTNNMTVTFEAVPACKSSTEKLVRIYHESFTGAHYVSEACFKRFYKVVA